MVFRRFIYKGPEERLHEVEAALKEKKIDRRTMHLILKCFEINPGAVTALEKEFPDV